MKKLIKYLGEVKSEFKKVIWPTKSEAFGYTSMIIVVSLVVGVYLSLIDNGFSTLLETYLLKK